MSSESSESDPDEGREHGDIVRLLNEISTDRARLTAFNHRAKIGRDDHPFIWRLALALQSKDSERLLHGHLEIMRATTTADTWPVYYYVLTQLALPEWRAELLQMPRDIHSMGFSNDQIAQSSLWLDALYAQHMGTNGLFAVPEYILQHVPDRAWWSLIRKAEIHLEMGHPNRAVQAIATNLPTICLSQAGARRARKLLRRIDTPAAAVILRHLDSNHVASD